MQSNNTSNQTPYPQPPSGGVRIGESNDYNVNFNKPPPNPNMNFNQQPQFGNSDPLNNRGPNMPPMQSNFFL